MKTNVETTYLLDEFLPQVPQFKNPTANPIQVAGNIGVWVSAHLDFDYEQFLMVEFRAPYLNPEGPTMVDNLFVHIGGYGKRQFEWDDHSHEFFDTSGYMDPYVRFIRWAEQILDMDGQDGT